MVGLGVAFGLVVLLAGILITVGLTAENGVVLTIGFVLLAACAIAGVNPGFLTGSRKD